MTEPKRLSNEREAEIRERLEDFATLPYCDEHSTINELLAELDRVRAEMDATLEQVLVGISREQSYREFRCSKDEQDGSGIAACKEIAGYVRAMMNDKNSNALKERDSLQSQLTEARERLDKIVKYCEPHTDFMWAASIVGIALDCDFRDVKQKMGSVNGSGEKPIRNGEAD